jgi:hypothetical protein
MARKSGKSPRASKPKSERKKANGKGNGTGRTKPTAEALSDQPPKPPAHLGNKDASTWLEGHAAGRTSLNASRAQGFRSGELGSESLGDAAANVVAGLANSNGLGTEPATHREAA